MAIRSELDCIPCLFAQAVRGARTAGLGEAEGRALLAWLGGEIARLDPDRSPPENGVVLYRRLTELAGGDPFLAVKRRHTAAALGLVPPMRRLVEAADDPLDAALRLASAGNRLDPGALADVERPEAILERALGAPSPRWDRGAFRHALAGARSLLLVADNAGEIVFDRVLLETIRRLYPGIELTVVVRGMPVINDATREDAEAAGLGEIAELLDTATDIPGFVPELVPDTVRRAFDGADVVLSKGQGNYETLTGCGREVFFLLQVKCAVVARHTGQPVGSSLLLDETPRTEDAGTR